MKMAQVLEAMKPEKVTPHTEKEMELRVRLIPAPIVLS